MMFQSFENLQDSSRLAKIPRKVNCIYGNQDYELYPKNKENPTKIRQKKRREEIMRIIYSISQLIWLQSIALGNP